MKYLIIIGVRRIAIGLLWIRNNQFPGLPGMCGSALSVGEWLLNALAFLLTPALLIWSGIARPDLNGYGPTFLVGAVIAVVIDMAMLWYHLELHIRARGGSAAVDEMIRRTFSSEQQPQAAAIVAEYTGAPGSDPTWMKLTTLDHSRGDLAELRSLVDSARADPRDGPHGRGRSALLNVL